MKRTIFAHPQKENAYLRVRDEGSQITCTYKEIAQGNLDIHSVKELETEVKDYETLVQIFTSLELRKKSVQETYREVWEINNEIEIMIDQWPGLEPFIEIEGKDEEVVKEYTEKLSFDWNDGLFGATDQIYKKYLGIEPNIINNLPEITFKNPPKI